MVNQSEQVKQICIECKYDVSEIVHLWGTHYKVLLNTRKGMTQSTLDSRFKGTVLMSDGFGIDAKGIPHIKVMFR